MRHTSHVRLFDILRTLAAAFTIAFFAATAAAQKPYLASELWLDTNRDGIYATLDEDGVTTIGTITVTVDGKADKVTTPTAGNLAGLDAEGNLTDSGISPANVASASYLTTGVLDNARFSAYADLLAENRLGSTSGKVAIGDHNHSSLYYDQAMFQGGTVPINWLCLFGLPSDWTPSMHAANHKHNGGDEIATATPASNAIPKADGSGKLDVWISLASTDGWGRAQLAEDGETAAGVVVQGNDRRIQHYQRIITVSPDDPRAKHTTIAAAVAEAGLTTPSLVQVWPGTYAEEGIELPSGVYLAGVDRDACILSKASTHYDGVTAASTALLFIPYNGGVEDMTIRNTRIGAPGYGAAVAVAAVLNGGSGYAASRSGDYIQYIRNCIIDAPNNSFALILWGNSYPFVEQCEITGSRFPLQIWTNSPRHKRVARCNVASLGTGQGDETPLWINGAGVALLDDCRFHAAGATRGGVYIDDEATNGGIYAFNGCWFSVGSDKTTPGKAVDAIKAEAIAATVKFNGCKYSSTLANAKITYTPEDMGTGTKIFNGPLNASGGGALSGTLTGNPTLPGNPNFTGAPVFGNAGEGYLQARWNTSTQKFEFGNECSYDVDFGLIDEGVLGTTDAFSAAGGYKVGATEIVSSTRIATLAGADIDGAVTINDSGSDADFRVESDGNANMLVVDGGLDAVSVGAEAVSGGGALQVTGAGYLVDVARSTDTQYGPVLRFYKRRTTGNGQANDESCTILAYAEDDGGTDKIIGDLKIVMPDAAASSVDGDFVINLMQNNATRAERLRVTSAGNLLPGGDGTQDVGASAKRWKDIYATNGTIQTSSARRKSGIRNMPVPQTILERIEPKAFTWDESTTFGMLDRKEHLGFLAEDVDAALRAEGLDPMAMGVVVYDDAGQIIGLRYAELIPVLWQSLRDERAARAALQTRLDNLESRIATLERAANIPAGRGAVAH